MPLLGLEDDVVNEISQQLHLLEGGKSFSYVDLGLTELESDALNQLNIETTAKFDQFGELEELKDRLTDFLNTIGQNDSEAIETTTDMISNLVQNVITASHKNSAWLSVRTYTPGSTFDIPRWHIDGADYGLGDLPLYSQKTYKFTATLKGPSTLIYDLPSDQRNIFVSHFDDRSFIADFLSLPGAEGALPGQGVFFTVGDNDKGTIHSEPKLQESRLFISVVAGDDAEIENLYLRRHIQATIEMDQTQKSWEESHVVGKWEQEAIRREAEKAKEEARRAKMTPMELENEARAQYQNCLNEYENAIVILKDRLDSFESKYIILLELLGSLENKSNFPGLTKMYLKKFEKAIQGVNIEELRNKISAKKPAYQDMQNNEDRKTADNRRSSNIQNCCNESKIAKDQYQYLEKKIPELQRIIDELNQILT